MLIPLLIWVITIFSNGTPIISLNTTLSGGFVTLALPALPQSYVLIYVNNTPTPGIVNNTYIIIPIFGTANVSITYIPKIQVMNNFVEIDIINNETIELVVPNNVLIYNITLSIINMTMVNKELVITAGGPGTILYTTTATQTGTTITTPSSASRKTHPIWFVSLAVIIVATVIILVTAIALRGRALGKQKYLGLEYGLNEYETAILKYIKSKGGSAYESDISKDLGIPRTTVWRSVKRLESLGLVEVRKVEGKNLVIIKRKS
ncbi:MAG: helix-turn-helix domain-containing protein [Vulcanisaeta sp.]